MHKFPVKRFLKFCIVGGSGVIVNSGILFLLSDIFSIDYRKGSLFAIECAIISNFTLNYLWTWHDRKTKSFTRILYMLVKFNISSGFSALAINWSILVFLTEYFNINHNISNIIGILFASVVNFVLSHFWAFNNPDEKTEYVKKRKQQKIKY